MEWDELVAITLGLLRTDWLNWYGVRAWVSLQTALKLEPGDRLNLFTVIPQKRRLDKRIILGRPGFDDTAGNRSSYSDQ
jgi:hypothetical protein